MTQEDAKRGDQAFVDIARRALQSSLKSLLSTEEGIRNLLAAILPTDLVRDLFQSVASQVEGFRKDLVKALAREIRYFIDNLDIGEEARKVLTGLDFEVKVSVKIREAKEKKGRGR